MTNINNELKELLNEIFYNDPENINRHFSIIKNSNNIVKIVPYFITHNTNNTEDIKYTMNLINILQEFFKMNNNLIHLFMKNSIYSNGETFYECLIILYSKMYIEEKNKLLIEELIKNININYSLTKSNIEIIYQNLSRYFRNDAKDILTSDLLNRYLNLLNIIYSSPSTFLENKTKMEIKNYIYFNGIDSKFSFILNNHSCNHNTDFPTMEKGFSFVFWIKLDSKLINEYFSILNGKFSINLINVNIGGELLVVNLESPSSIIIFNKEFSSKSIDMHKIFNYDEWNSIIFMAEIKNNKLLTKLYINNNNSLDNNIIFSNKINKNEKINNIDLFENLLGKVSSILFFSFTIDSNLISFFTSFKGFYKKNILNQFLMSLDKDYYNSIDKEKIRKNSSVLTSNKIKIKLKDYNINNLICCFCPFTFDKNKNIIEDVFGNFIGKLAYNDGINKIKNNAKHIENIGGINNLLPILELMIFSLKKENPYKFIDNNIYTEKNLNEFLNIIKIIVFNQPNILINKEETKFFEILIMFLEKTPSHFYTLDILKILIDIINISYEKQAKKDNIYSLNLIYSILLNEFIVFKFPIELQIEIWNYLSDILIKDLNFIKKYLNISKICIFIRNYDAEKYDKFCCKVHACFNNEKEIELNKNYIMNPELNIRIEKIFYIIQFYMDNSEEENNFHELFKLISLDSSPCLQNKIIFLFISYFLNENISSKSKEKTLKNLLRNNFFQLSEYIFKISLLETRLYILKLFNIFIIDYKNIIYEYFIQNSIIISEIIHYFCLNLFPTNLIIEIDKKEESYFLTTNQNLFLNEKKINDISKTFFENFFDKNKKYIRMTDIFNREKYNKNIEYIWSFLNSSIKFVPKEFSNKKNIEKNWKKMINPFIFNYLIYFVSKISTSYLLEFLIEILTDLKDDSIINRNIFYKSKKFFPWLIDTIFYFYNAKNKNLEVFEDKNILDAIKSISIKILCDLFSHRREKNEIIKLLRYIFDYSYYYKNNDKEEDVEEILEITRIILIKIFEESKLNIDIKTKIIFEFIILFKNSENIFKEERIIFQEINQFCDKEFFEDNYLEDIDLDDCQTISNNKISDLENHENKIIINDKEEEGKDSDLNIIGDNENEIKDIKLDLPENKSKKVINFEENDLIPNYFYEGINYNNDNDLNKSQKLEYIWKDYKLFILIHEYYKRNLWGLENLTKDKKEINKNIKDNEFKKITKKLFKFYVDTKENKNILIKRILKYIYFDSDRKNSINVLYLNIILLSISIDISENDSEKEDLIFDYQQILFFFILASFNISSNSEKTEKLYKKNYPFIENFLYNIIGYGFLFFKRRDSKIFKKLKKNLINPIFQIDKKNNDPKKSFYKDSIIGKLFTLKKIESNDDTNLNINLKKEKEMKNNVRLTTDLNQSQIFPKGDKGRKLKLSKTLEKDNIFFNANQNKIIKEVIEETINVYKFENSTYHKNYIYFFYGNQNYEGYNIKNIKFNDELNINKIEEIEKNIKNSLVKIIKEINIKINQYKNKYCFEQLIRIRDYKKIKKRLFSWQGFWSDKNLFYRHPEYLKLRVKNHFTKDMTKILLSPILDINYYLPNFKAFDKSKLFNPDDYKYFINLNFDKIFKFEKENFLEKKKFN